MTSPYKRIITMDNYEENKMFVGSYLSFITFLARDLCEAKFVGRVVRELIFPMSEIKRGELNMETFMEILKDRRSVILGDVDILFDNSDEFKRQMGDINQYARDLGIIPLDMPNDDEIYGDTMSFFCDEFEAESILFFNPIFDTNIVVNFILVEENCCLCSDFNVNNLTWDKSKGFDVLAGQWEYSNFFRSHQQQTFETFFHIREHIKKRTCEIMMSVSQPHHDTMTRIELIMEENYTIQGFDNVFKHHENVDDKDRVCIVCLDEIEAGEKSISLCGKHHLVHWNCGKKWWRDNKFNCMICKTNILF
jgi:hypothetical protein